MITTPVFAQTSQQNGSGLGTIHLAGTYSGSPAHIQADWNGSGFQLISNEVISAGNWSGDIINAPRGQATLNCRFSNDPSVTALVSEVGIGDVYVCIGDSIANGRLTNAQTTSSFGTITATCYEPGVGWKNDNDPTSATTANGSFWPLLGSTLIRTTSTYPVAFINCAVGSTGLTFAGGGWLKSQGTYYTPMASAITAAALVNPPKGFICHFGANDAADGTQTISQAAYLAAETQLVTDLRGDYPGCTVFFAQLGNLTTGSPPDRRTAMDNVRAATAQAWALTGCAAAPVLYDLTNDGVHYATNAEGQAVADRWWVSITNALYGLSNGRGPRVASMTIDATKTIVTHNFDRTLGNTVGTSITLTAYSVEDNGALKTISTGPVATSTAIVLQVPAIAGTCTVDLGSQNDGNNVTLPSSTTITLSDARTITLPAEPFTDQAVTAASGGTAGILVHPGMTGRMAA